MGFYISSLVAPCKGTKAYLQIPYFIFLNFPYSLRTYSLPAPQGCQSAQTLYYIALHITLYYITLPYHGILQLALYTDIDGVHHVSVGLAQARPNDCKMTALRSRVLRLANNFEQRAQHKSTRKSVQKVMQKNDERIGEGIEERIGEGIDEGRVGEEIEVRIGEGIAR